MNPKRRWIDDGQVCDKMRDKSNIAKLIIIDSRQWIYKCSLYISFNLAPCLKDVREKNIRES